MKTTNTSGTGSSQNSRSHSETGHIKNVANFNVLIITCQGFGASYNPSNSAITVPPMQALYASANASVTGCDNLGNTLQQRINDRVLAFILAKPTASRIMAALVACGADAETIKNAKTINRKIQGQRAGKVKTSNSDTNGSTPATDTPTPVVTGIAETPISQKTIAPITVQPVIISVSQQSYDRLISNFQLLVNYASQVPGYNPNESDLSITALMAYLATLQAANNAVITAHVNYNNAITARTKILYDKTSGLVHVALQVKQYVNSVFGPHSIPAKQVNKIHFKTLIRK
jgi:hypothetical protein